MIAVLRDWVVTLGGAAIMCALAQGMLPAKSMERELKLVLSLVILLSFFTALTRADLSALTEWSVEAESVQAFQASGQGTALSGTLLVARSRLSEVLESDLAQAYGEDFVVEHITFGGTEQEVVVQEVVLRSLNGVEAEEMGRYLDNRFGLKTQVREVNQS